MPVSISRRKFLVGTAGTVAAAALGDGFLIEPTAIEVTRHDVVVPGLPHELEGFRIACITDVHLHKGIHHPARATLELLGRERPHLVALIGDICNHFDDLEHLTAFARAARGLDGGDPTVWVLHAPAYVDRISVGSVPRPAAIISGHTHGGQVRLPFYTPYTPYGSGRFVAGWYRDTLAPLYVSRGIGTVSLPVRLFCPPELPIFTLKGSGEPGAVPSAASEGTAP